MAPPQPRSGELCPKRATRMTIVPINLRAFQGTERKVNRRRDQSGKEERQSQPQYREKPTPLLFLRLSYANPYAEAT
ncbi:hypothetical protein BDQ94DRAFT_144060 [Aspergillus welwitschiae]|uniref:Uncharacterized protein n=1 Tax=Aspergillus welwitschiae TaxID=1341132 RepID=A0A3F3Q2P6_9EURO|nr:hypothetical protein BDQ94DRAFT_144060 [Aspergillus welwitschiae]RDH33391.1 hypothetical protein BDQ94DRAFT_144060 [Aspergillus welwitschiae]